MAIVGYNTTLQLDNAAGTLTTLGEVVSITPINVSVGTVETTHLTSTSGYREYLSTLSDAGEASVTISWTPGNATDIILYTASTDRLVRTFKPTFPNSKFISVECFVTDYAPGAINADGKLEATFTVKFTGVPTYG
jgi:hypothetical protein